MQKAVERAISIMWDRYSEPLSLNAMAKSVYLSRFYFCRLFRSITGTTPGRFLTAIRLYKAKHLLLETELSVTDIAYSVGYNSLGTFISRFTRSVGVSPARYRSLARHDGIPPLSRIPTTGPRTRGTVSGCLSLPPMSVPVKVYVGVFDSPIVQGAPASCDILAGSGSYVLHEVPEGEWYLRAAATARDDIAAKPSHRRPLAVGSHDPIVVSAGDYLTIDIELHPAGIFDLPILVALPELDSQVSSVRARARRGRPPVPGMSPPRLAQGCDSKAGHTGHGSGAPTVPAGWRHSAAPAITNEAHSKHGGTVDQAA